MNMDFEPGAGELTPAAVPPWISAAMEGKRVLLASASPRRRELLGMIVRSYNIVGGLKVDERYPATLAPEEVPAYLSRLKASAYSPSLQPGDVLITADTVVIDGGKILGKPADEPEACAMLRRLGGHVHTVVTGVTITTTAKTETFSESTRVKFAPLSEDCIEEYVRLYAPLDKAGAYGIQEWIGAVGIEGIDGCFYNVMGLPLHALYEHLRTFFD